MQVTRAKVLIPKKKTCLLVICRKIRRRKIRNGNRRPNFPNTKKKSGEGIKMGLLDPTKEVGGGGERGGGN